MSESTPPPVDPLEEHRHHLAETLGSVRESANSQLTYLSFSYELEDLSKRQSQLAELQGAAHKLRTRGYRWRPDVESNLLQAAQLFPEAFRVAKLEVEQASAALVSRIESLGRDARVVSMRGGDPLRHESEIHALAGERDGIASAIRAVADRIEKQIKPIAKLLDDTQLAIKDLNWVLDQFEAATFKLAMEEHPYACAEGAWLDPPDGQPKKGVLFLTDLRIRFEQRETIITKKKFVFFTAESHEVKQLLLNEPLGNLTESLDSTKGWILKDQFLTFAWAPRSAVRGKTSFQLNIGDAKQWDQKVEDLRVGNLAAYHGPSAAAPPVSPLLGVPVRWPESCSSCNARLVVPVRGQTILICVYCSTEHPVTIGPASS
jgi:hypothetical protein